MTPQEMIAVIQAYADGKAIETNDGRPDWWAVEVPVFNFHKFTYRVKPAALRPHWPAITRNPMGLYMVSSEVFSQDNQPKHIIGFVRLATEYPPVMLP